MRLRCIKRRVTRAIAEALGLAVLFAASTAGAQMPDVVPPAPVSRGAATYPQSASTEAVAGTVVLAVTVSDTGDVTDVEVVESLGAAFDEAAIAAVKGWKFAPALRDGNPVAATIRVGIDFTPPLPAAAPPRPESKPELEPEPLAAETPVTEAVAESGESPETPYVDPHDYVEVSVHGRDRPPSRGASEFNLHVGELRRVPRQDATELLELAPGILLTNEGGDGHPEQIFLRGFDARLGQDVEFSVDGTPINAVGNLAGNGYADLNFIITDLVDELRVVEGPFDPRQGNFAVAGSADYHLALDRRGLTTRYTVGSFDTNRLLLLWGPQGLPAGTFGGVELGETAGFGQNRAARSAKAMGQVEHPLGERGRWTLAGTAYGTHFENAGVLREDDYQNDRVKFFDTYDTWQGGEAQRYSLSSVVETKLRSMAYENQVYVIRSSTRMRENFTGYLLDVQQPLQEPHEQRGDRIDRTADAWTTGMRGYGRWMTEALGQHHQIELGYAARGDFVEGKQFRVQASNGVPYRRDIDLYSRVTNVALYADLDLHLLDWLALRGGVRGESFFYDIEDRCASTTIRFPAEGFDGDASCHSQQPDGEYRDPSQRVSAAGTTFLPRAAVLFGPFAGFQLSLSYGQGARAIDPQFVNDGTETPFTRLTGYEGGVAYANSFAATQLVMKSIFFRTDVGKDLIFSQTEGRNTLASGSSRTGWAGSFRTTGRWFDSNTNLTLVQARFDDTHLVVPYVPDLVVRTDEAVFADLPFEIADTAVRGTLAAGLTYIAPRALPYDERGESIFTVDASATFEWRFLETGLMATNLFDNRYRLGEYNYASDFYSQPAPTLVPARHFSAGPPRAIYLTVALHLGDEP